MQHVAITELVFMSNVVPELGAPGLDNQRLNLNAKCQGASSILSETGEPAAFTISVPFHS